MKRNIIFILVSIVSMCLLADYFTGKTITRKLIGQVTTKKKNIFNKTDGEKFYKRNQW